MFVAYGPPPKAVASTPLLSAYHPSTPPALNTCAQPLSVPVAQNPPPAEPRKPLVANFEVTSPSISSFVAPNDRSGAIETGFATLFVDTSLSTVVSTRTLPSGSV